MTQEKLLTIGDVAESLRIHRSYVYKLIKAGSLPQGAVKANAPAGALRD